MRAPTDTQMATAPSIQEAAVPLPPLPKPMWPRLIRSGMSSSTLPDAWSAQQMQDYARAAIVAYIWQEELPP